MKTTKYTVLHNGDIVLIDFGKSTSRARTDGRRLAYITGRDGISNRDQTLLVIPIFRTPTRHSNAEDIQITKKDCAELRRTQYLNPENIQKTDRHRVKSVIGFVDNKDLRDKIKEALIREAGD